MTARPRFDAVADRYDRTRGGERRGGAYAAALHPLLAPGGATLEVGVGTGVVALGLRRLGHRIVGIDVSPAMLDRARVRLPGAVALGDALDLPFPDGVFADAVAVWVAHALADPRAVFEEVARVLAPGGRFHVCPANRSAPGDVIGAAFEQMADAIDAMSQGPVRPDSAERILALAGSAGYRGEIRRLPEQRWPTTADAEIAAIVERSWSALVDLDAAAFETVTAPTMAVLRSLPPGELVRRAIAEIVTLEPRR